MFPERTWVMVDGIYRYNFMEKIYTGIYNNRFEHLLPVQTVPVLGQVKKLSLSRGKRLYMYPLSGYARRAVHGMGPPGV